LRPSNELEQNLRRALADRALTEEEWQALVEPIADATSLAASAVSRKVLEVWSDERYQLDPQTRAWMRAFLESRGYDVPEARPAGVSTPELEREIEATNVGEVDQAFEALASRAGAQDGTVLVAVLDNGFDLFHPELGHKGWINPREVPGNGEDDDGDGKVDDTSGWDFLDGDGDLGNPEGDWHGTHVAGIATRGTERIRVLPCRVVEANYDIRKVADAIHYACEHGARLFNMSFGVETAEQVSVMRGVLAQHPQTLFVVACGNDGRDLETFDPDAFLAANAFPNLAVVAACDANGERAAFSNYGLRATVAARGTDVLSSIPQAQYGKISGTSMAAPEVVNTAAKCLLLDPALEPVRLQRVLMLTSDARESWRGKVAAGGPLNPERAYALAALSGLVRRGEAAEVAARRLQLSEPARTRALKTLPELLRSAAA
jgi:subtilisin family serine protease